MAGSQAGGHKAPANGAGGTTRSSKRAAAWHPYLPWGKVAVLLLLLAGEWGLPPSHARPDVVLWQQQQQQQGHLLLPCAPRGANVPPALLHSMQAWWSAMC